MKCPKEMPDEKLIQFYLSNNPTALATLTDLYKDKLYNVIYTMVKDKYAAEEIFRNVFLCIINNLMSGKNAEDGNFLHWATMVAQQLCIEYNNKVYNTGLSNPLCNNFISEFEMYEPLPSTTYYESHIKLRNKINMLPGDQREVMILNHYGNVSFRDIATKRKCSVTTILDIVKSALNNIRKLMTE